MRASLIVCTLLALPPATVRDTGHPSTVVGEPE
jgi:hypothetical protein